MANDSLVRNWHDAILGESKRILGRELTDTEAAFITSRGALIALEMIGDHVRSLIGEPEELQRYLRSESDTH